VFHLKSP